MGCCVKPILKRTEKPVQPNDYLWQTIWPPHEIDTQTKDILELLMEQMLENQGMYRRNCTFWGGLTMKNKRRNLVLDKYEYGIIINTFNDFWNRLIREGSPTEWIDEVLLKLYMHQ